MFHRQCTTVQSLLLRDQNPQVLEIDCHPHERIPEKSIREFIFDLFYMSYIYVTVLDILEFITPTKFNFLLWKDLRVNFQV